MVRKIPLPLQVRDKGAMVGVYDASGVILSSHYYEEEPGRRMAAKIPDRAEAIENARDFARMKTDKIERSEAAVTRPTG